MPEKIAIFRCDASPQIGGGHVMRCLTLADDLKARKWICLFSSDEITKNTMPLIKAKGYDFTPSLRPEQKANLVVIDHYNLDADYERQWESLAEKVLVIDDLADRPHACDALIDQTYARSPKDYKDLVPPRCHIMAGAEYALLRAEFKKERHASLEKKKQSKAPGRLLITMGSMDPDNVTATALGALNQVAHPLYIDVVLGQKAPHLEEVKHLAQKIRRHEIHVHAGIENIASLMSKADLAIGAGGTTSWERCCLGLPTIVIEIADNQTKIARELHTAGAIQFLGKMNDISSSDLVHALEYMYDNPEYRLKMSHSASLITDGTGTEKVLKEIGID